VKRATVIVALLVFALIGHFIPVAEGAETGGVNLPDRLNVGGTKCRLAGSGVRKKYFIKIYAWVFISGSRRKICGSPWNPNNPRQS